MTDDRDPKLQNLFDAANRDLAGEAFVARVMSQIDNRRRRAVLGWICLGLVLLPCGWWFAWLLRDAAGSLTQILSTTLIDVDIGWPTQVLAPVNSIAGLVALVLLVLRRVYRGLFS